MDDGFLIAQLSDLHIGLPGTHNDSVYQTVEHLRRAVAHLNELPRRPDAVLVTGDLVEAGSAEEYARLRAEFDLLSAPSFVIPGNHDAREQLALAFADRGYFPRDGGFLHYVLEQFPLRLIGLDSVTPGKPHGELCAARLAWLDARLSEAPTRPTMLFMHHPPFRTGVAVMDQMGLRPRGALAQVLARHPQVLRVACGHVHRAITGNCGATVAMSCPSTAHQLALELVPATRFGLVMEPPGCLLHLWHEGELVSHLSLIGKPPPTFFVHDGEGWIDEPQVPPGFSR